MLIDPRVAAEGVTVADLGSSTSTTCGCASCGRGDAAVSRARDARGRLQNATGADAEKAKQVQAIYDKLVNTPEGIRYNKPGLQAHVSTSRA